VMQWWNWLAAVPIAALVVWLLVVMLRAPQQAPSAVVVGKVRGTGRFDVEVVGESHYRAALEGVLGADAGTDEEWLGEAELVLEDSNPHDPKAVQVCIQGHTVGYLSRADARDFRARLKEAGGGALRRLVVDARVYGGGSDRLYSVTLDMPVEA
jgi:hypothetical protein